MGRILNYDIRPEKQVERKIILEILNELRGLNYKISGYRYVGMPSVFYYDFIFLYKYLYIEDMIGFESLPSPKRMKFNKPYDFIKIILGEFSVSFKKSHFSKKSILWLDYTSPLDRGKLENISDVIGEYLKAGSIIIVTTPSVYPIGSADLTTFERKIEGFGDYLVLEGEINTINKINGNNLSSVYYKSLKTCIDQSLTTYRQDLQSVPLFHLQYSDGTRMASFGFMIEKKNKAKKVESFLKKKKPEFCDNIDNTYKISLPVLTSKERKYLDQMQNTLRKEIKEGRSSSDLCNEIEIAEKDVVNYIRHNKYHPNYYEGIV